MIKKLREGCIYSKKRWSGDTGEHSLVDENATDALMKEAANQIQKLEDALKAISNCDWPGPIPLLFSRADWMQGVAREALMKGASE